MRRRQQRAIFAILAILATLGILSLRLSNQRSSVRATTADMLAFQTPTCITARSTSAGQDGSPETMDCTNCSPPLQVTVCSGIGTGCQYFGDKPCPGCPGAPTDCPCGVDFTTCACKDPCGISPILIDVAGDGFRLTDAAQGVNFNLDLDSDTDRIGWTAPGSDDAFLCLDRNGNGKIDDGCSASNTYTCFTAGRSSRIVSR